ncbi:MAG: hypothetical protein SO262_04480 [Lentihominibacter sp.]|nr:hypothetical protein [Lentihominibacter sp.]
MRRNSKLSTLGIVQRALLVVGFLAMEFPGILFFKDISEPRLFGLPFAYGFMLLGWAYMCIVLFWAYMTNWGEPVVKSEGGDKK